MVTTLEEKLVSCSESKNVPVSIVAAVGEDNIIGIKRKNDFVLPWYIPEDLEHFKQTTLNSIVLMGKNTYDSLPKEYKPLPGRLNLVLSRSEEPNFYGSLRYVNSLDDAFKIVNELEGLSQEDLEKQGINFSLNKKGLYVIGGGQIYDLFLNPDNEHFCCFADKIILTKVFYKPELEEGEEYVYFPNFEEYYGNPIIKPMKGRTYFSERSKPKSLQYQILEYSLKIGDVNGS